MECTTIEEGLLQLAIASQVVLFVAGTLFRSLEKDLQQEKEAWGFKLAYLVMPAFFIAYYSQDFLFKDWSNKNEKHN